MEVTGITGTLEHADAWSPLLLTADVTYDSNIFMTYGPDINWSVRNAGDTNAKIIGNSYLFTTAPGTVVITAAAEGSGRRGGSFSKNFTITVRPAPEEIQLLGAELISHTVSSEDNPVLLKGNLDLELYWVNLLNMLIIADKYVHLDLSGSTGSRIPEQIVSHWLQDNKTLSITLPESITGIGSRAFSYYKGLTNVNMGSNVLIIEDNAFRSSSLASVIIPDSVISIGNSAFYDSRQLANVSIGNNVETIGNNAFRRCRSLANVIIPDSVISIGINAFMECSSLTNVIIGNNVETIGDDAFNGCAVLAGLIIPESVTSIGNAVFNGCSSLAAIDVSPGNAMYSSINGVLYNKAATTLIRYPMAKTAEVYQIPETVASIENDAFRGCSNLTEIVIPDSVISIGDGAFMGCSNLTEIVIPAGVTGIGNSVFMGCSNLAEIVITGNVTGIGDNAFNGCASLAGIIIPDSVVSIGDYAFSACVRLTSIVIPDSVISFGDRAFSRCDRLLTVTFHGTLTQNGFTNNSVFPGDLRLKYFANSGGPGTYTRQIGSERWNKI